MSHEYLRPLRLEMQAVGVAEALGPYADQTAKVNVINAKPGELGPTEVQVLLVRLNPMVATGSVAPQPAAREEASRVAFRAAARRHYPPIYRNAGISGYVALSMQVGADGRARDVEVVRGDRRFAGAARAVVNGLTFTNRGQMLTVVHFPREYGPVSETR